MIKAIWLGIVISIGIGLVVCGIFAAADKISDKIEYWWRNR